MNIDDVGCSRPACQRANVVSLLVEEGRHVAAAQEPSKLGLVA